MRRDVVDDPVAEDDGAGVRAVEAGDEPEQGRLAAARGPEQREQLAVQFTGGVRSYFDQEVSNVYDEGVAARRSEALKIRFRSDIEARWDELKKK